MTYTLVILLILSLSYGQGDTLKIINPPQIVYREADILILLDKEVVTVNKDRTTTCDKHLILKVIKDKIKQEYGVIKIPYNDEKEEVKIIEARTFKPNGNIMRPESDAIFDMSVPEAWKASVYTNAKLKVVTFPGIERNAILECRYRIMPKREKPSIIAKILSFCKKRKREHFFGEVLFGGYLPIINKEFTLVIPKGMTLKYKMINGEYAPEITEEAKNIMYRWKLKNLPPIVKEPYMPNIKEIVPHLIYSSFDSWDELGQWFANKFYKCIEANKEIRAKVEELARNQTSEEAIRNIFLYVLNQYRDVELDLGAAGYTPNKVSLVYHVKYGDCRDKAALLVSMLREAGMEAFPALINRSGVTVVKEVPSPKSFDDIIVAIKEDTIYYFLDPKAKDSMYGYLPEEEQGVDVLIVLDKGILFMKTPTSPVEANLSKSLMKLNVSSSGGINGELFCHLSGFYDRKVRNLLRYKSEKEREQFFATRMEAIQTGTKLVSYSISDLNNLMDSVSIHVAFKIDRITPLQADILIIRLPNNPLSFTSFANYVDLDQRQYTLVTFPPRSIEYGAIVEIPWGFGIEYIPKKFAMENELAKAEVLCESRRTEITYKASFTIKKRQLSTTEYKDFKNICDKFLRPKLREIILRRVY